MSLEHTTKSADATSATSGGLTCNAAIFLGGPAGAGKTTLAQHLVNRGWFCLDMDRKGANRVLELLDAPADHPSFQNRPLVIEGGFLEQAPKFQALIERLDLTTFWLTGTKSQLVQSRLSRNASWDDSHHILNTDWIGLIERCRTRVRWDYQIQMWHDDGTRKTFDQVRYEIESCVTRGVHESAPW